MLKKGLSFLAIVGLFLTGTISAFGQPVKEIKKPILKYEIRQPLIAIKGLTCSLPIPLRPQETSMWCWAASGEMVMEFVQPGLDVKQCEEANAYYSRTDCCGSPVPNPCINGGGWDVLAKYGFSFNRKDWSALSWDELKNQICANKPVMFAWHWDGGGGHMMVVTGLSENIFSQRYVHINNPWPPGAGDTQVISYDAWIDGDGYSFWAVYYDIQKKLIKILPPLLVEKKWKFPIEKMPLELKRPVDVESTNLAVEGLKVLDRLVTQENAQAFGFIRKTDASQATVGRPIREFRVHLDDLKSFLLTDDPIKIVRGGQRLLYPVLSAGRVSSSIRIEKYKAASRIQSLGNITLIKMIEETVGSSVLTESKQVVPLSTLEIPAMGIYFLSKEEGGKLWLASVFDDSSFGLKKGTFEPALEVFRRLQPFAKEHIFAPMR
jgi:hypothetical protein